MSEVKWIKISTGIFDDEKIKLIEAMPEKYAIITSWFKLLCLAGKENNDGVFILNDRLAYTDEMLAVIFRMDVSVVRLALETFETFGMIEIIDGVVTIPNWQKWQSVEGMDKIREQNRLRKQAQRQRDKEKLMSRDVTRQVTDGHATEEDIDIDTDIEEENIPVHINESHPYKKEEPEVERGRPRDYKECCDYFRDNKLNGDPAIFFDYYNGTNWMIAGMPITDWKAIARNWSRRESGFSSGKKSSPNKVMTAAEYEEKHKYDIPDFSGLERFCKEMGVEYK